APARWAALQQTLSSPAAAWTSWFSSPPGQAPSLSGTSGPRERRAPARWGGLAAGALLSGSPPGRAGALPPGPLKLRLDLDQCPLRPQGAESPADIEHRELPCNWSVPQAVCLPSRQRCGRVPMLSTRVFVTIPTPVTSPV